MSPAPLAARLWAARLWAARLWPRVTALWGVLRALSGDDAYERYRAHHAATHTGQPFMSRREFCADAERRKWSGVNHCC